MLLCRKGLDLETGYAQVCNKCYNDLVKNKLPTLSRSNLMWIGDVSQDLQELTLPEQKLIALYRHSSCVIKLFSITGDPSLAQTTLKGNVITFPQNISDIARCLPLSPNILPNIIKIIFVDQTLPSKDHVRSILSIRREIIRTALIWLYKNNILYKDINIDHLLIDTLPINDVPDCLWNTMSLLDESQSCNVERSSYVPNNVDPNELFLKDVIPLNTSALIDTSVGNENIYVVPHGSDPVNEYFNTSFLPGMQMIESLIVLYLDHIDYKGLYPTLFSYGVGGVENERRQVRVPYSKHIRYLLSYHDHRFEMNKTFIFVTFNILQRRTACVKSRILLSRPYFSSQTNEIN
ncbi:unnamed protein product [Rotaria sp. Silwood2]|nr:unnamed protein product [Rotaria sp. Silwood2]CAF3163696.1 unnamed protein product [Rotaria sp. Silwood2]CAF4097022.1 unnamed protein product [Rotaria sp. Silwood2]CAF4265120.1 unnamed protein product [Rotaria sp. Silwood2]